MCSRVSSRLLRATVCLQRAGRLAAVQQHQHQYLTAAQAVAIDAASGRTHPNCVTVFTVCAVLRCVQVTMSWWLHTPQLERQWWQSTHLRWASGEHTAQQQASAAQRSAVAKRGWQL